MHRIKELSLVIVAALALTACQAPKTSGPQASAASVAAEAEKQRELAVERLIKDNARVAQISYPLLRAAAAFCPGNTRMAVGFYGFGAAQFPQEYRPAARRSFGITDRMTVVAIAPDSPSHAAGLIPGDEIIRVNGVSTPDVDAVHAQARPAMQRGEAVRLHVRRQGLIEEAYLRPEPVCDYNVVVSDKAEMNAYADGQNVVIGQSLLRFFENDTELALVVAHEIAHNAMGHLDARKNNAVVAGAGGLLLDILAAAAGVNTGGAFTDSAMKAGAQAYSVEFEQEADYVGLYLMARAGYETRGAANFWRRLAAEDPGSIELRSTHPTNPERFVAIETAVAEIEDKRLTGAPLLPNAKDGERILSASADPSMGLGSGSTSADRAALSLTPVDERSSITSSGTKSGSAVTTTQTARISSSGPPRWRAFGVNEACGFEYLVDLRLEEDRNRGTLLRGEFWRGAIDYDVHGTYDPSADRGKGRGLKVEEHVAAPRIMRLEVSLDADSGEGSYLIEASRCKGAFKLTRK